MDGGSTTLLLILILLTLHALIRLGSGAIANARPATMRSLASAGNVRAQQVLKFADLGDRLRLTVMVLTTAIEVSIAILAVSFISLQPTAMPAWLVYVLTGTVTVTFTLALGELVPEAVGTLHADTLALWFATPLRWTMTLLTPVTTVLTAIGTAVSGLFGSSELVNRVTEEEILTLVDAGHTGGTIEAGEKEMIYSILELNETQASELMVPRIDIVGVEAKTPIEELDHAFFESGYSRLPVYIENMDNIKGVVIAKDLLMAHHNGNRAKFKTAGDLARPIVFVPETRVASELLKDLRAKRVHMAIVVDEYGGTAGLFTIEDLIEQIVGEIQDEYDDEEAEFTEIGEHTWRMDASIDVDDVNALLTVELPTTDSDTLGGLIYTHLGRVPLPGEEIELDRYVWLKVDKVDGRRIRTVTVKRLYPATETSENATAEEPPVVTNGNSQHQDKPEL